MSDDKIEVAEDMLTQKQMEIIDFINLRQMELSNDIDDKIKKEVVEKWGEEGQNIVNDLMSDESGIEVKDGDCPDCGKMSDEFVEKSQSKLLLIDTFLNDEHDEIINQIIESVDITSELISTSEIANVLKNVYGEDKVDGELVKKIQTKILFMGICEGWLYDEVFNNDYIEENHKEE